MKKLAYILAFLPEIFLAQNIGIGTAAPTANLHIKSDKQYIFRLVDGQNTDVGEYTLTAQNTLGKVVKTPTGMFRKITLGTMSNTGTAVSTAWADSGATLVLEPGRWLVQPTIALQPDTDVSKYTGSTSGTIEVSGSLSDSKNFLLPSADIEGDTKGSTSGNGLFYGVIETPIPMAVMRGIIIINNNTAAAKTYHLIAKVTDNFPASTPTPNIGLQKFGIKPTADAGQQNLFFAIKIY